MKLIRQMDVKDFIKTTNTCPLQEGGKVLWPICRAVPDDIELTGLEGSGFEVSE